MFFDSFTNEISANEGNLWVVRAFAALLEASLWVSVEPGKKLVDTAFVTILWTWKRNRFWVEIVGYKKGIFWKSLAADPTKSFRAFHKSSLGDGQQKPLPVSIGMNLGNAVRVCRLSHLLSPNYEWVES